MKKQPVFVCPMCGEGWKSWSTANMVRTHLQIHQVELLMQIAKQTSE